MARFRLEDLRRYLLRGQQVVVALLALALVGLLLIPASMAADFRDVQRILAGVARVLPLLVRQILALLVVLLTGRWLLRSERRQMNRLGFHFFPSLDGLLAAPAWASLYELLVYRRWKPGRIAVGRLVAEQRPFDRLKDVWLGSAFETHILTIAAPGTGKARAGLVPNLLTYPGSALVIDPKGELARITAGRRGRGETTLAGSRVTDCLEQEVHIVDPGNETVFRGEAGEGLRGSTARYNPLAELDLTDPAFVERGVNAIANILIPENEAATEKFWDNAARSWLKAIILHVVSVKPIEQHHLPYVRRLLKAGDEEALVELQEEAQRAGVELDITDAYAAMIASMKANPAFRGEIAMEARQMERNLANSTGLGVIKVADTAIDWIGGADMAEVLSRSDFSLVDLKAKPMTVYVCILTNRMQGPERAFLAMMLQMGNMLLERDQHRPMPRHRVVFMIDEFTNIGYVKALEVAFPLMRGLGLSIWAVVQDINQVKRDYKGAFDVIYSTCKIIQMMGTTNINTATWASELFGGLLTRDQILGLHQEERKQLVFFGTGRTHRSMLELTPYDELFPRSRYDRDPANPRSR